MSASTIGEARLASTLGVSGFFFYILWRYFEDTNIKGFEGKLFAKFTSLDSNSLT